MRSSKITHVLTTPYISSTLKYPKKVFATFDNIFHVHLIRRLQKYAKKIMAAFWHSPIYSNIQSRWTWPRGQTFLGENDGFLELFYFTIMGQMLQTLNWVFQCSRNIGCCENVIYFWWSQNPFPRRLERNIRTAWHWSEY